MRILVVGGSGFLGRHLVSALAARRHEVVCAGHSARAAVALDVTDPVACRAAVVSTDPDCVVNLAGAGVTAGSSNAATMARVNRDGAGNVAAACAAAARPRRLVHVASSTEPLPGKSPESEYSQTKADGTARVIDVMESSFGGISIARIHNVYGAGQPEGRFIADVVEAMRSGGDFLVRFPDRVRDFCLADEAAIALVDLVEGRDGGCGLFDIGTGAGVRLLDAAQIVRAAVGVDGARIRGTDPPLADPAPSSVAGDTGLEVIRCPTTLEYGVRILVEGRA